MQYAPELQFGTNVIPEQRRAESMMAIPTIEDVFTPVHRPGSSLELYRQVGLINKQCTADESLNERMNAVLPYADAIGGKAGLELFVDAYTAYHSEPKETPQQKQHRELMAEYDRKNAAFEQTSNEVLAQLLDKVNDLIESCNQPFGSTAAKRPSPLAPVTAADPARRAIPLVVKNTTSQLQDMKRQAIAANPATPLRAQIADLAKGLSQDALDVLVRNYREVAAVAEERWEKRIDADGNLHIDLRDPIQLNPMLLKKVIIGSLLVGSTALATPGFVGGHEAPATKPLSHSLSVASMTPVPFADNLKKHARAAKIVSPIQHHVGKEKTPVASAERHTLAEQARSYARQLVDAGKTQFAAHEASKEADKHNHQVITTVDGFATMAVTSLMGDRSVPLTPEIASVAAEHVANLMLASRYPGSIEDKDLSDFQKQVSPLIQNSLFVDGGQENYTAAEQANIVNAVSAAAEALLPADQLAAYVDSLSVPATTTTPSLPEVTPPAPEAPTLAPNAPGETSPPSAPESPVPSPEQKVPSLDIENYKGMAWTKEELKLVDANKAVYVEAAKEYDLPWFTLAVIHRREHGLALDNPSNHQGIYQFYGERKTDNYPPGPIDQAEFLKQTRHLAQTIRDDFSQRGLHDKDVADGLLTGPLTAAKSSANRIKDLFFSYNGRSNPYSDQAKMLDYEGRPWEGSPYVMNLADDLRDSNKDADWQQFLYDPGEHKNRLGPANREPGAWLMIKELAAVAGESDSIVEDDNYQPGYAMDCPDGAKDLGISNGGFGGEMRKIRLCSILGLPSSSDESDPTSKYYVEGSEGNAIVNVRVAAQYVQLLQDAKADGIDLKVQSSYRSHGHQSDLWDEFNHNRAVVGSPDGSNHRKGFAVDFNLDGAPLSADNFHTADGGEPSEANPRVANDSPTYLWVKDHAPKHGLKQYWNEPWHWSLDGH
ncbi:MAG: D-alanyl-D-alanine carboxypeptidase family protein [Patescibacteria group bacterium]|nr:D-alanyl-D-alanine carboxypeptidase family protein [Patescibacteria group bacterium]